MDYLETIANDVNQKIKKHTRAYYTTLDDQRFEKKKLVDVALSDITYLKDMGYQDLVFKYAENETLKKKDISEIVAKIDSMRKSTPTTISVEGSNFEFDQFIPCVDLVSSKEFLIHSGKRKISQVAFDAWVKLLPADYRKEMKPIPSRLVFDPMQSEPYKIDDFEGFNVAYINQYQHPKWMKDGEKVVYLDEQEQKDIECPKRIMDFMEHLFPNDDCRDFVFNWMHYALVSRCQTYLVLNGKKGVGKGILCERLLQNLVGENNYRVAPESMLESNFNAALENIRILVMDEISADRTSKINKLKKYANDNQNVEKKGVDATNTTRIYYSAVISNNDLFDMKLTWDERRFSVVDLADISLLDAWGKEEIDDLIEYMMDPEVIRQFGYWILYKGKKSKLTELSVYKGERFYQIVYHSLSEWQKVVVDLILSNETEEVFNLAECRTEYKRRIPNGKFPSSRNLKVQKFLEDFRYYGDKLGELEYDEDEKEYYIVKDRKFVSRKSSQNKQEENQFEQSEYGLL